jgi:hypothetical protein
MSPCRFGNEKYHVDWLEYEPGPRGEMSSENGLSKPEINLYDGVGSIG